MPIMRQLVIAAALIPILAAGANAESSCNKYGVCTTNGKYDPTLYEKNVNPKTTAQPLNSLVAQSDHEKCAKVTDYKGCMEFYSGASEKESSPTVPVKGLDTNSYEKTSVLQLKIRGTYGRYLTFIGRTSNSYAGTSGYYNPGSPGTVSCNTYGSYTTCNRSGYVAPSYTPSKPGGVQHRRYRYELDCLDRTFNREGDMATAGGLMRGWMSVNDDPTALAVESKYCPIINTLPKAIEKKSSKKKRRQYRPGNR
tara:strand:+ start:446 stop:1204 length:759 start_codon:yes stop_codon:yes gene_type:complete